MKKDDLLTHLSNSLQEYVKECEEGIPVCNISFVEEDKINLYSFNGVQFKEET